MLENYRKQVEITGTTADQLKEEIVKAVVSEIKPLVKGYGQAIKDDKGEFLHRKKDCAIY